jgi:Zn-dependent peptidase ImmA (M78 family)
MLKLELIELADLIRPEELVNAIIQQNPDIELPIPVEELARLAGISKIEPLASEGFEGTLIANAEKSAGVIFYNSKSPRPRRRFTIGHELGHFLLPWHRQTTFNCTSNDFNSRIKNWEFEANKFSAELLMPQKLLKPRLHKLRDPEFGHVLTLADEFGTSVTMTAHRLAEQSDYPCAFVFSKDNKVRYSVKSPIFEEHLCLWKGNNLPGKSPSRLQTTSHDDWHELDSTWWLKERQGAGFPETIFEQTLCQEDGYKITLLTYD